MNLLKLKTIEQLRQFLDSTQALEFASLADTTACYAHIAQTIQRFAYANLCRADRSVVLRYLERTSGYSSAQVKRLVSRALSGEVLQRRYIAPTTAYAKRFTDQDKPCWPRPTAPLIPSQELPRPMCCGASGMCMGTPVSSA